MVQAKTIIGFINTTITNHTKLFKLSGVTETTAKHFIDAVLSVMPKGAFKTQEVIDFCKAHYNYEVTETNTNNILSYCQGSETIRQLPQNYCIATKQKGYWMIDYDIAADIDLVIRVTKALKDFDNRYGTGLELLAKITPNSEFRDLCGSCNGTGIVEGEHFDDKQGCLTCNGRGHFN